MRKLSFLFILLFLWLGASLPVQIFDWGASSDVMSDAGNSLSQADTGSMPGSCTSFTVEQDETLLFGNNEDYKNPDTYLWVEPASEDGYGGVYLGYQKGYPQGGINEKGLAFDGLALPPAKFRWDPKLASAGPSTTAFWGKILRSCATVEEAIQMASGYNWGQKISHQIILADASGDSAVLSAGVDGSLAITRKPPGKGFLVATNFNLANPENTEGEFPCPRYETATAMLNKVQEQGRLSVKVVQDVLDAVHQEGANNNTLYSNIFDLHNGVVYLYYWHQYGEVVDLDVKDEISKGAAIVPVRYLFSEETQGAADLEFGRYQGEIPLAVEWVSLGWLGLSVLCLLALVLDLRRIEGVPLIFKLSWVLPVFFLGPFGLLVYWVSGRKADAAAPNWTRALGSSVLSASGVTVTFVFLFGYYFFFNKNGSLGIFALLIPFATALFIFRSPWTAVLTGRRYLEIVRRLVLVEAISTLISVGVFIAASSFVRDWLGDFFIKTTDPGNGLFWGVFALYTLGVSVAVFPFQAWLAARGVLVWVADCHGSVDETCEDQNFVPLKFRQGWPALLAGIGMMVLSVVFGT